MSEPSVKAATQSSAGQHANDLYRAVWRWHFYAGLLVLPFLISLSLTGGLYLFRDEIDNFIHADLKQVSVNGEPLAPSALMAAALTTYPGTGIKYTDPVSASASAEVTVRQDKAGKIAVYVDPYSGAVLGQLPDRGTVMWLIRNLHSLKYFGTIAGYLLEIAAGWSIMLVATGLYLWWPRKQRGGIITVRGSPKKRVFWRDLHAVTGLCAGMFIVFLAFTGMPWSAFTGGMLNQWVNGYNYGYPAGVRIMLPMSDVRLTHQAKTSWSLEQAQIPQSLQQVKEPQAQMLPAPLTIDQAVAIFRQSGMHRGFAVNLPLDSSGVYSGSVYPDDVFGQRVIHLDQYSGKALIDVHYKDYGPVAQALEFGINIHLGQQFGLVNQIVLLLACVAIILLAVAACVMWWKRRPRGGLGIPPLPQNMRVFRPLIGLLLIGGLIFPLVGLSLIVMLILDIAWIKYLKPRGKARARPFTR